MPFQDHFSTQSDIYRQARPTYPDELFAYLNSLCKNHDCCWDVGTGNGQAAVSLAKYFKKVIATDPSAEQINNAMATNGVEYRVASAEQSGLPDESVDLITAATAAHWFNHELFYPEALRVARPNCTLALWTYSSASITPEINELMEWFMYTYLYDYWPDGRWYVRQQYSTLPFPFQKITSPDFYCNINWSKQQWLAYVCSWSAYTRHRQQTGADALQVLLPRLNELWDNTEVKSVRWPLHLLCARLKSL
ncbi:MAG: class I SAM-dependent methyltransferase [Chitinophagales bacterium]|nr:class I SAM-dependent methyltransferase [Chitinophagales bacterium]